MKKHGLFKIVGILLFLLIITTFFVPGRGSQMANLGIIDVVLNSLQSLYYFFDTGLFILVVAGLYGVLNKTGAYKKLLDSIVTKLKQNGKSFIIASIIIFALLVSVTGLTLPLFIFVPFVVSIILLLGYDKLVAVTSTIGAMMIGLIGGLFINFKNPDDYYSVTFTTFEKYLKLEGELVNIFPKILLLVGAVLLLILYVLKYIKDVENKKVKYELNDNEKILVTEVKADYKKIKIWPLIIVLILMLILLILGLTPWNSLYGIKVFDTFNTWLTKLAIQKRVIFITLLVLLSLYLTIKFRDKKKVIIPTVIITLILVLAMVFSKQIGIKALHKYLTGTYTFTSLFTASPVAFGNWQSLGTFLMPSFMILFFTLIIKLIYKVNLDDVISDFLEGTKKAIPTIFMIMFAFTVLVCSYNNGFIETIITATKDFNIALTALITMLGSLLHIDLYYTVASTLSVMITTYTDTSVYPVLAILFQTMYGLVSLIAPTSILLIIGLVYYDIPYTTWLKFIWRLLLKLIILVIFTVILVTLIL